MRYPNIASGIVYSAVDIEELTDLANGDPIDGAGKDISAIYVGANIAFEGFNHVPVSSKLALDWLEDAHKLSSDDTTKNTPLQNICRALYGAMLAGGVGVSGREPEGKRILKHLGSWITEQAEQGHLQAQRIAAFLYDRGLGVDKNPKEALRWYEIAANRGDPFSLFSMGLIHSGHHTGASINYEKSAAYFERAANMGHANAQYEYGYLLITKLNNPEEGVNYLLDSANQGRVLGQYHLGDWFAGKLTGTGKFKTTIEQPDEHEAYHWYAQAADQGFKDALVEIAQRLEIGKGSDKNVAAAFKIYVDLLDRKNDPVHGDTLASDPFNPRYPSDMVLRNKVVKNKMALEAQATITRLSNGDRKFSFPDGSQETILAPRDTQGRMDIDANIARAVNYEAGTGVPKNIPEALSIYYDLLNRQPAIDKRNLKTIEQRIARFEKSAKVTTDAVGNRTIAFQDGALLIVPSALPGLSRPEGAPPSNTANKPTQG
jgi:TPR repeat protein